MLHVKMCVRTNQCISFKIASLTESLLLSCRKSINYLLKVFMKKGNIYAIEEHTALKIPATFHPAIHYLPCHAIHLVLTFTLAPKVV